MSTERRNIVVLGNGGGYSDYQVYFVGFSDLREAQVFAAYMRAMRSETDMFVVAVGEVEWWQGDTVSAAAIVDSVEYKWKWSSWETVRRHVGLLRSSLKPHEIAIAAEFSSLAWLCMLGDDDAAFDHAVMVRRNGKSLAGVTVGDIMNEPVSEAQVRQTYAERVIERRAANRAQVGVGVNDDH